MKKNIIIGVIMVVIGAGAFYEGMAYAQSNRSLQANLFQNGSSQQGGRGGRFQGGADGAGGIMGGRGGNFINGQIISKDDKSLTIKLANGGTQFIFFSPSTQILKTAAGTSDDLQNGITVSASGTTNGDGSVTAQMIQIRPAGMDFTGRPSSSTQQTVPQQQPVRQ